MNDDSKNNKTNLRRREFFLKGFKIAGASTLMGASLGLQAANRCQITGSQAEGPFYPVEDQSDKDWDLTRVKGKSKKAQGEVVVLQGIVQGEDCRPIKGALVEIWQACKTGRYSHPGDTNPAALDPDFQYWGRFVTNSDGLFYFKTIKPGAYPAGGGWIRPPHIHVKVHLRGYEELTTQVYFAEEEKLNNKDRILQRLSKEEQKNLVVEFKKSANGLRVGEFPITLKGF